MNLKQIQKPIINEMDDFRSMLRSSISSDNILIDKVVNYILKRKGKQIRPLFVFLSAGLSGTISNSTYRAAILIESKYSVLIGDYLLSKGLELSVNNNDFKFLGILSEAVKNMSEGEITQLKKSKTLNINEKDYFKIINQKTASLFSSCCEMGSSSSGANKKNILLMRKFGSLVGQAFQIRDDLFGYLSYDIGKPSLNDFKQRKMTLPLIYALSKSNSFEKREILKNVKDFKSVEKIISFVKEKNGIVYSENKMNAMIIKSKKILNSFPDSVYKESINNLLDYTINRVK